MTIQGLVGPCDNCVNRAMPTRVEPASASPAQAADTSHVPTPAGITPELLKTHSITPEEYASIEKKMGRVPSLTELGIFSVMWSEHCSLQEQPRPPEAAADAGDADDGAGERGAGAGRERRDHRRGRWVGVRVQDREPQPSQLR